MIVEILITLLIIFLVYASCNIRSNIYLKVFCKKQTEDTGKDGQVTVAPAENTDTASSDDSSLVDMQKSDDATNTGLFFLHRSQSTRE